MIVRIFALAFIFVCTTIAWVVLGGTVSVRTDESGTKLRKEVGQLWGSPIHQSAPTVSYTYYQHTPSTPTNNAKEQTLDSTVVVQNVQLDASTIDVELNLDHRQKGLLWYATYRVGFKGTYRIVNTDTVPRTFNFTFPFPNTDAVYDNFHIAIGKRRIEQLSFVSGKVTEPIHLAPGAAEEVSVSYKSNGMEEWWYNFGETVSQVRNFSLTLRTNFDNVDFPERSISPTAKNKTGTGWTLHWKYSSLLSGVQIGTTMPGKLNPGPWVQQVTFFAPVSLFLFFFLLFIVTTIKKIPLHPMNYFFISSAFFSFHLLLAYLVDHVSIHLAFTISSLVSIGLVISYMRLVVGARFAFVEIGLSQFVYLIVFSYTFFFQGYTGLTITIVCITTLFIVMQATARINWEELFAKDRSSRHERYRQYSSTLAQAMAQSQTENRPEHNTETAQPQDEKQQNSKE